MPISPVSGEVNSQEINDNLSYLDNKLDQVNASPLGTLNNLSELTTKYPNGANGYFVVLESDGKTGYMYTWNGIKWEKGALFQSQGIANDSITTSKILNGNVTEEKTSFFETSINLFDKDSKEISENKGYSQSTQNIIVSNKHNISAYIQASTDERIVISNNGVEVDPTSTFKIASFSKDGSWLKTDTYLAGGIVLPVGTAKIKVQYVNSLSKLQIQKNKITPYENFVETKLKEDYTKKIEIDENMIIDKVVTPRKTSFIDYSLNIFDINNPQYVGKGFSGQTGNVIDAREYNISHMIDIQNNKTIFLTVSNNEPKSTDYLKIAQYDSNGNWLKTNQVISSKNDLEEQTDKIAIQYKPDLEKIMVSFNSKENFQQYTETKINTSLVKIEDGSQIKDGIITEKMLSFDVASGKSTKEVDLIVFCGQSNMAGRGVASEAPIVDNSYGYEYRAISSPNKLHNIVEPFGINENKLGGINEPGMKTGSLVSSFVNSCYELTNTPIIAVSASKGGTTVEEWQPTGILLPDAIERFKSAENYLISNGYKIRSKNVVWLQGETDAEKGTTKEVYKTKLNSIFNEFKESGVDNCFVIRIGNHRTNQELMKNIKQTQTEVCQTEDNIILCSTILDKMTFEDRMKDTLHYTQEALNICGKEAATNVAFYLNNDKEATMYDWTNQNLYYSYK